MKKKSSEPDKTTNATNCHDLFELQIQSFKFSKLKRRRTLFADHDSLFAWFKKLLWNVERSTFRIQVPPIPSMSNELQLILDDALGQFNYSGGQWTLSTLVQWYSGTSYYPGFAEDGTHFGSFSLTFEGTSIAFIGNTPPSGLSQSATVAIDGGRPYNITYGDTSPPSYTQWYQSPTLADGSHTISVDHLAGTAVDFALINVGSNTPLFGKRIFVDDNNSAIKYTGKWTRNTNKFIAGTLPDGYPAGNSTHRSSTPGDTITFRFFGSSPAVYGIFSWADLGVLSATYSLDGNTQPDTLSVTTSTPEYVNNYGEASNVLMFSDSTIQPGDHTLVINITQCINQTFMLDYITYLPSFSSLATMPNLTSTATPAANGSTTTTQSTSTTQLTTQSTSASQINNGGNGTRTNTGTIVGGVGGGLATISILVLLLVLLRKRRGKENNSQNDLTLTQTQPIHVVPQVNQQPPLSPVRRQDFTTIQSGMDSGETFAPFQPGFPTHHGSGSAIDLKHERANFENQQRSRNIVASPLGIGLPSVHSSRGDNQYNNSIRADLDTRNFVDSEPPSYDALSTNHPSHRKTAEIY